MKDAATHYAEPDKTPEYRKRDFNEWTAKSLGGMRRDIWKIGRGFIWKRLLRCYTGGSRGHLRRYDPCPRAALAWNQECPTRRCSRRRDVERLSLDVELCH